MQKFIIGTNDFGVGEVTFKIDKENSIINNLTIVADEETFQKLSDDEDGEWFWVLYPPRLYFKEIPFELKDDKIEIIITEEILDNCDVALYLMEHDDIGGKFIINKNGIFVFEGCTYISGKEVKLELEVNLTL